MKVDLYDLNRLHNVIFDKLDCDDVFTNDGSVEYKEFIEQFKWYQRNKSIISNYYSMVIIRDGINKFANDKFWKLMKSYK